MQIIRVKPGEIPPEGFVVINRKQRREYEKLAKKQVKRNKIVEKRNQGKPSDIVEY